MTQLDFFFHVRKALRGLAGYPTFFGGAFKAFKDSLTAVCGKTLRAELYMKNTQMCQKAAGAFMLRFILPCRVHLLFTCSKAPSAATSRDATNDHLKL